jgi:hypothetical protein
MSFEPVCEMCGLYYHDKIADNCCDTKHNVRDYFLWHCHDVQIFLYLKALNCCEGDIFVKVWCEYGLLYIRKERRMDLTSMTLEVCLCLVTVRECSKDDPVQLKTSLWFTTRVLLHSVVSPNEGTRPQFDWVHQNLLRAAIFRGHRPKNPKNETFLKYHSSSMVAEERTADESKSAHRESLGHYYLAIFVRRLETTFAGGWRPPTAE